MTVAVGVFRDEERIADQEGRHHRFGRDMEGLEQEGADEDDEDQDRQPEPHRPYDRAFVPLRLRSRIHRRSSRRPQRPAGAYRTIVNRRVQRTLQGQRQNCQAYSPSPIEKKMICARPTRFSSGTYPTALSTRLSVELSRLSPIMK